MKEQFEILLAEMEKGLVEMRPATEEKRSKALEAAKALADAEDQEVRLKLAIQHLKRAIDTMAEAA